MDGGGSARAQGHVTLAPNCRDAGPVIAANQSEGRRADLQKLFFRSCAAFANNQSEGSRADLQKVIFQIVRGMSDPMEVDQTQPLAMDFALK